MGQLCRLSQSRHLHHQLTVRIGIVGYGRLGRSLELLAGEDATVETVGVFTRRNIKDVHTYGAKVLPIGAISEYQGGIDVLCLCQGSSCDLPAIAPSLAESFNTVDAYDNHRGIDAHRDRMDVAARESGHTSLVAVGWDPGFLSLIRLYSVAFIPGAVTNTFWGRGVSQGHSEAIRRIDGVKRAVQYTVPREDALTLAGLVRHPLSDTDRHRRVCYVVAEEGSEDYVRREILTMPDYFIGYDTEIHFVDGGEFDRYHTSLSHRGRVCTLGSSGRYGEIKHSLNFDLDVGSNPDLTASIMLASARATHKLNGRKHIGAYTVFDVPPSYFLPLKCENANNYL